MMQNTFDFGTVAHQYDDYYQSDFGKKIDELEKAIIEKFLKNLSIKEILEIGCGTGHWTEFFVQKGFSVKAMDISDKMLAVAKSKNMKNTYFFQGDALNLSIENESVENIIAITSLEFTGNQQKAFDEIYRILKPRGYFICAGLNETSEFWKDKKEDIVYKNANFLNKTKLQEQFSKFGNPVLRAAVIIENTVFCDEKYSEDEKLNKGAFIAGVVQKIW
ncbi:MAG: class I SAM-dependent methyltransferase [Bacteroidales bacterium]|nr:class I SAM-dependent methyltransferase [Bacteroidales bacterium]